MGILSRFTDIITSNINALLDKAEDPSKLIDQYLRNAMEDLAAVKEETAAIIAETKRCKRLVDETEAEIVKYEDLAKRALRAGNEGDAKIFIAEKQKAESNLAKIMPTYAAAKENEEKMRQMHNKLQDDIENLKARRANIKATIAVAKTQERVNKAKDAMSGAKGSIAAFERMEEKASEMLDRANAKAELAEEGKKKSVEELAEKYSTFEASVDDELARMKAELDI